MTYSVVIPNQQTTKKIFTNLTKAKAYARTLPVLLGAFDDDCVLISLVDLPARHMYWTGKRWTRGACPDSWFKS